MKIFTLRYHCDHNTKRLIYLSFRDKNYLFLLTHVLVLTDTRKEFMRIPYKSKTVVSPTYVTNSGSRKKPTLRPGSLLTHWNLFNGLEHKVKGFDIRRLLSLFRMEYPTISLLHPLTFYRSYQRPYFISIYDR